MASICRLTYDQAHSDILWFLGLGTWFTEGPASTVDFIKNVNCNGAHPVAWSVNSCSHNFTDVVSQQWRYLLTCAEWSIPQTKLSVLATSRGMQSAVYPKQNLSLLATGLTRDRALLSPAWLCWGSTCLPLQSGTFGRAFRALWTASPAGGGASLSQICPNRLALSWDKTWQEFGLTL